MLSRQEFPVLHPETEFAPISVCRMAMKLPPGGVSVPKLLMTPPPPLRVHPVSAGLGWKATAPLTPP